MQFTPRVTREARNSRSEHKKIITLHSEGLIAMSTYDDQDTTCSMINDRGAMFDNSNDGDEFGCQCGTVVSRVGCILSYNGSHFDVMLNYSLIVLNLIYCVVAMHTASLSRPQPSTFVVYHALGALVFVIGFQLVLCLALGCSGVSIIWCAMCGWIMSERRQQVDQRNSRVLQNY